MFYTSNPVMDAANYCDECERKMSLLPHCDCCGDRITNDYFWMIGNEIYCEKCLNENFRRDTPEV